MKKRQTRRETEARLIELLGGGMTRKDAAAALGIQVNSLNGIVHDMRRDGRWPINLTVTSPYDLDEDGMPPPMFESNERHLADLAAHHTYGAGERAARPTDLSRAIVNTRQLMRRVRPIESPVTSMAALCAESH